MTDFFRFFSGLFLNPYFLILLTFLYQKNDGACACLRFGQEKCEDERK